MELFIVIFLFILGALFLNASHIPHFPHWLLLDAGKPTHPHWKLYGIISGVIWISLLIFINTLY